MRSLLLAGLAGEQGTGNVSAASKTYFITTLELSSGEGAQSQTYSLKPIFGNGVLVDPDTTSTFASADLFALPDKFTSMVTALTTGCPASVRVGGLHAVITQQLGYQVAITKPDLDPGVHPAVVSNAEG